MPVFSATVPVAPGQWHHAGTDGPGQAASLGRWIADRKANSWNQATGGRFDHRMAQQDTKRKTRRLMPTAPQAVTTGGGLFSSDQMQRMQNRAVEQALLDSDLRNAQKQFLGRGLSLDAGTQAGAIPRISQAYQQAAQARYVQPLMDQFANQQFNLQQRNLQLSPLLSLLGQVM